MNAQLHERMNKFREKWSNVAGRRDRLTPTSTDEDRKAVDEAQRRENYQRNSEFLAQFNQGEIEDIRIYLDERLRPQIVGANPQPLQPGRAVREVDAEVMNEYYFFRELL